MKRRPSVLSILALLLLLFFLYPTIMELLFSNRTPLSYDEVTLLETQKEHYFDFNFANGEVTGGKIRYAWRFGSIFIPSIQGLIFPYWSIPS